MSTQADLLAGSLSLDRETGRMHTGWSDQWEAEATRALDAAGYPRFSASFADDRPLPAAFSLSRWRKIWHDQFQVGTCYGNMATIMFMIHTACDNAAGGMWDEVVLSRRFACYACQALEAKVYGWRNMRNPADGGSIQYALISIADESAGGVGLCREEIWPYLPKSLAGGGIQARQYLATPPPKLAVDEANLNRLMSIASVDMTPEKIKRMIFNGHPVGIGIWWPNSWDSGIDAKGRTTGIGPGGFGHAIPIIGWVDDWDGHTWYQIENSHGLIYRPLPAEVAARVPNYSPILADRTSDFWAREDQLMTVYNKSNSSQAYGAAGLSGFKRRDLPWQGMGDL